MPTSKATTTTHQTKSNNKTKTTQSKLSKKTTKPKTTQLKTSEPNSQKEAFDLTCNQSSLNDCLEFVSRGVPSNPTLPILSNVLLVANKTAQLLHLTTYNLEFGLTVCLEAKVSLSGSLILPMSAFQQMIRKFPSGEMHLKAVLTPSEGEEESSFVKVTIATPSDPNKQYKFRGLTAEDFPPLPSVSQQLMTVPANLLIAQLSGSLFAASTEETKKILNGSYFQLERDLKRQLDSLKTWTTDGHRLVFMQGLLETKYKNPLSEPVGFTVPLKALRELERNLNPTDRVTVYFEPSPTSETQAGVAIFEWRAC